MDHKEAEKERERKTGEETGVGRHHQSISIACDIQVVKHDSKSKVDMRKGSSGMFPGMRLGSRCTALLMMSPACKVVGFNSVLRGYTYIHL